MWYTQQKFINLYIYLNHGKRDRFLLDFLILFGFVILVWCSFENIPSFL